jgi:hypothetical protein
MSRSPRWRNRRRQERQQEAAVRAAKRWTKYGWTQYSCGHFGTLTEMEHNLRAHPVRLVAR